LCYLANNDALCENNQSIVDIPDSYPMYILVYKRMIKKLKIVNEEIYDEIKITYFRNPHFNKIL